MQIPPKRVFELAIAFGARNESQEMLQSKEATEFLESFPAIVRMQANEFQSERMLVFFITTQV